MMCRMAVPARRVTTDRCVLYHINVKRFPGRLCCGGVEVGTPPQREEDGKTSSPSQCQWTPGPQAENGVATTASLEVNSLLAANLSGLRIHFMSQQNYSNSRASKFVQSFKMAAYQGPVEGLSEVIHPRANSLRRICNRILQQLPVLSRKHRLGQLGLRTSTQAFKLRVSPKPSKFKSYWHSTAPGRHDR